jgi:hypothetical protein
MTGKDRNLCERPDCGESWRWLIDPYGEQSAELRHPSMMMRLCDAHAEPFRQAADDPERIALARTDFDKIESTIKGTIEEFMKTSKVPPWELLKAFIRRRHN